MKRHWRAMAEEPDSAGEARPLETFAEQVAAAASNDAVTKRVELAALPSRPSLRPHKEEPAKPDATHTLVLIGELDRSSTHMLEAELERLCETGIRAITLDLSKLSGIDAAGVAVIAFRARWCEKRGCELELIGATRAIAHAFELAGVAGSLTFKQAGAS
jgi:anti-anti-sigma factor